MDKLKFTLLSTATLLLLGGLGYWSLISLQTGAEFRATQDLAMKQKESQDNADTPPPDSSEFEGIVDPTLEPKKETTVETKSPTKPATSTNQTLINELQKIIDADVIIKLKASGTRVGTVQNFLNIYNKTSNRIDNDYGAGTIKTVTAFQKDQGITPDGQADTSTFQKMIDWLKKQ